MKEAFVYRWREISTNKWYVGYHKGTADDGYICSSKIAKPLIQSNPNNWQRKILRWGTKKEMVALERRILVALKARTNPNSYNRSDKSFANISLADLLGYDLNKMSAKDISIQYAYEIKNKNWNKVYLIDSWLIKRLVEKSYALLRSAAV
jgi:hypothetical protein